MTMAGTSATNDATVVVVGLGNIGSHLLTHVARMPWVGRLVLIDRDRYEATNHPSQSIGSDDIGEVKVTVQAGVVRRINPEIPVQVLPEAVENVPLGFLRGAVLLACVDSRATRQYLNEVARNLGVPWIDAGVEPGSWLARVNVYEPGVDVPCLECAWDQRDYDALPQTYPCDAPAAGPATNAPSSLGALAAALQAIECQKLLAGRSHEAVVGGQVLIDAWTHKLYRTSSRRNPMCRLDHRDPWVLTTVEQDTSEMTIEDAFALGRSNGSEQTPPTLRVPPHVWAGRLVCGGCGLVSDGPRLSRAGGDSPLSCRGCGGRLSVPGFDLLEEVGPADLTGAARSNTLDRLGLRNQDVLAIDGPDGVRHFQIAGRP